MLFMSISFQPLTFSVSMLTCLWRLLLGLAALLGLLMSSWLERCLVDANVSI